MAREMFSSTWQPAFGSMQTPVAAYPSLPTASTLTTTTANLLIYERRGGVSAGDLIIGCFGTDSTNENLDYSIAGGTKVTVGGTTYLITANLVSGLWTLGATTMGDYLVADTVTIASNGYDDNTTYYEAFSPGDNTVAFIRISPLWFPYIFIRANQGASTMATYNWLIGQTPVR